ncbi:MAG: TonB-dependent receptor [Bacteroidetes bacterium]|nr:TonB-dependent receptor [Bacteroidota bacterium]
MFKHLLFGAGMVLASATLGAQSQPDSLRDQHLKTVDINARIEQIERLPETQGGFLWSGKKNEVINLQNLDANIAEKTPRQIFAKVPGVFVYDMDGSGNQTNISTRGLDPHRGWEFNIRTDGIMTNSDIYGYPASHFSLPMEAIGRIELVRGTGALQYGAQFGGMLNYVIKQPDSTRKVNWETINSIGSYGLLSTYNALGGKIGRLQYYAFYSKRVSDGYRENSESDYDGQGLVLKYAASKNLTLGAELLRSNYIYHIPGPLTDAMFNADPRQSSRSRNYFNPEIYVPSVSLEWETGPRSLLVWRASAVLGERRSVMWDRPANIADTINRATFDYNARQVDIDAFNSYTTELRYLLHYHIGSNTSTLAAGMQYINNDLHRRQLGKGTTGSDYDLTIEPDAWGRDLHLKSNNIALFVENKFQITRRFSLSPGLRFESGNSRFIGSTTYYDPSELENKIEHQFPLLGINADFVAGKNHSLYAGFSQAYRPVILKDIIPGSILERTDKNLKDAYGYNAELGWRGATGGFKWDVSAFMLQYNNRLGSVSLEENGTFYILRTNIGNSLTYGLETFGEYGFEIADKLRCNIFTSTAFFHGRYQDAAVRSGNTTKDVSGNKLESVPDVITRNGISFKMRKWSLSGLYSFTAETFADPFNTVEPTATGAVGLVPSYGLLDLHMSYLIYNNMKLRLSANNVTDKQYFTKRPTFYPGPGIWPSDGRSVVLTLSVKL